MSRKRVRSMNGEKAARENPARRSAMRRKRVGIALGLLIFAGALAFLFRRDPAPVLPPVPTAQLDAASVARIEQHLDAVRADPRSGPAWGRLGALLRSFEFREQARHCFVVAERLDPTEPRWPYLHGLLVASESPGDALMLLRRAVSLCGNQPDAPRLRLARLLAESGQWNEARRELKALLDVEPGHGPAALLLAHVEQGQGRLVEAVTLAQRSASDPRTARASWTLLAMLQQRLGDTNAARLAEERVRALPADAPAVDPFESEAALARGDPRKLSDRAQEFLMARRLADALPVIRQLVRDHPEFSESWLLLGRMQLLEKDYAGAEQSIRRHLQLDPQSVNGLFQLGMVQLGREQFADAVATFEKATKLKPDFGPAFYNLGFALGRLGRKRDAIAPFREAIRHNPERIDTYFLLADLHVQFGEKAEARELARQAEALNPSDRRLSALRQKISQP